MMFFTIRINSNKFITITKESSFSRIKKKEDYPIFFATMQKPSKDNSGDKIYLVDPQTGLPALDKHNHLIVDHDLFQLSYMKQDGTEAFLEPGIAEAFEEFAKKEGLSFFR